ncbi:hypothetical protein OSTOST_05639, partial [Ostertagia ostertagi]
SYLKKFSYSNARSEDFWDILNTVDSHAKGPKGGHLNLQKFADHWIKQMGFPLVTVKVKNSSTFEVTQSRYKRDPNAKEVMKYRHPKHGFKWYIPIWYQMNKDPVKFTWLTTSNFYKFLQEILCDEEMLI